MDKLFSTKDAADFLHVSIRTLKYWRKTGKLVPIVTVCHGDRRDKFYSQEQLSLFKTVTVTVTDGDTTRAIAHVLEKEKTLALFLVALYNSVTTTHYT